MNAVDEINAAWGWVGMSAVEVLAENDFGNLILKDDEGKYWRLRPHDLCCQPVAQDREAFDALSYDQAFLQDWYMTDLVMQAHAKLGPLASGRKYCVKVPSVEGSEHGGKDLGTAPLMALIRFSGDVAQHIHGLPLGEALNAPYVE